jgi:hypothetical protein
MKTLNSLIILSALIALTIFGCTKNKDVDPEPTPEPCKDVISQEVTIHEGSVDDNFKKVLIYNSDRNVVKINYAYGNNDFTRYDTVIYSNGKISAIKTYSIYNAQIEEASRTFTFNGDNLISVNDVRSGTDGYDKTVTYTYNQGVLSAINTVYASGSGDEGNPENISSIVFVDGNLTSAILDGIGAVTIEYDLGGPNPYYGTYIEYEDLISVFSKNNAKKAYLNDSPDSPFFTKSFTFTDGKLATISETNEDGPRVTTITYTCLD